MTRNNHIVLFTWLLVDRTHDQVQLLVRSLEIITLNRIYGAEMSIRTNRARTRSLVKVPATKAELRAIVPVPAQGAVVRAFNEVEFAELLVLVHDRLEWNSMDE